MNQQSKSHIACRAYSMAAEHLLELPADNPAHLEWERHADSCPDCAGLLKAESQLISRLTRLQVPEPAYVRGRVMFVIRASKRPALFRRRDFAWGTASAFAGVVIGLMIATANTSSYSQIADASQQEEYAGIVSDSFDELANELTTETGDAR